MDRIKQYRVLGRDNVGRRNKSEEGKNSNAKPRDGYGPGLLFLGKSLPLDWWFGVSFPKYFRGMCNWGDDNSKALWEDKGGRRGPKEVQRP
jgi:hypothetical protein